MNIVKKFVFKILFVTLTLFSCILVYADDIPQKINIQGRLTTDFGDPITQSTTIYINDTNLTVTPDNEGLYMIDVDISKFGFSSGAYPSSFTITVDQKPSSYTFSSAPYSIYSSTAIYALELSTSGTKLANGNFLTTSSYTIAVSSANYTETAEYATKVSTTATIDIGNNVYKVWVTTTSDSNIGQAWVSTGTLTVGRAINVSSYTPGANYFWTGDQSWTNVDTIKVKEAEYATKVSTSGNVLSDIAYKVWVSTTNSDNTGQGWVKIEDLLVGTANKLNINSESEFSSETIKKVWAIDEKNKQGWVDLSATGVYKVGADLAEMYASSENLQPGDVVSIDTTRNDAVVKTKVAEDTKVAGVVSTEPGLLLNKNQKGYKLALVGKVPTKVCNEGGAIKRGDLLVSASIAGYAKKAGANPKPGTIIGKALENFSSNKKGTILVLVNLQ